MTTRNKAILWIVAVFVTGSLFGGFLSHVVTRSPAQPSQEALSSPPASGGDPERSADEKSPDGTGREELRKGSGRTTSDFHRLAQYLELDPAQKEQLRAILQDARQRYQGASEEYNQRRRDVRASMLREIRRILDDGQKRRLDNYVRRQDEQRQKHRERRPPPPRQ